MVTTKSQPTGQVAPPFTHNCRMSNNLFEYIINTETETVHLEFSDTKNQQNVSTHHAIALVFICFRNR